MAQGIMVWPDGLPIWKRLHQKEKAKAVVGWRSPPWFPIRQNSWYRSVSFTVQTALTEINLVGTCQRLWCRSVSLTLSTTLT